MTHPHHVAADAAGSDGRAGCDGRDGSDGRDDFCGPGAGEPGGDARAERVWRAMGALVLEGDDRRKAVADALGMSFFRVKALRRIAAAPGSQLSRLAAVLGTDRPYLTLVVDDLEKRGLVVRQQHPQDRRSKTVTATAEGMAAAARANAILGRPPRAMAALPPEDLAALDRILTVLLRPAGEHAEGADCADGADSPGGADRTGDGR